MSNDDNLNIRINSELKRKLIEKSCKVARHTDIVRSLIEAYVEGRIEISTNIRLNRE